MATRFDSAFADLQPVSQQTEGGRFDSAFADLQPVQQQPPAQQATEPATTEAAFVQEEEQRGLQVDDALQSVINQQSLGSPSQRAAFGEAVSNAAAFGFGDEFAAGARAIYDTAKSNILGDGSVELGSAYRKNKDITDARKAKQKAVYPNTVLAGEIAGQVVGSGVLPTASVFKGAGGAARVGNAVIGEGIAGGVYAAGESEATGSDLLSDVGKGFAIGSATGVGGELLGQTISAVSKLPVVNNLIGGSFSKQASNQIKAEIRKDLKARGIEINESLVDDAFSEIQSLSKSGDARLADSSIFGDVTQDVNKVFRRSDETQDALSTRPSVLAEEAERLATSDVSANQFSAGVVKQASDEADPLYKQSYTTAFDESELTELNKSPAFSKAFKEGKAAATDDVVATGSGGEASTFQSLDETQRALGSKANDPTVPRAERRRVGLLRDQLLEKMDAASPEFAQARQITKDSFNTRDNVELGQSLFKTKDADALEAIYAKAATDPQAQSELLRGAQDTMRTNIAKGVRGKNGKLVSDADIERYNSLANGTSSADDLTNVLNDEAITARTAALTDTKAAEVQNKIFSNLGIKDIAGATALFSLFTDPTLTGMAFVAGKYGVNKVAGYNRKQVAKEMQKGLLKAGASRADISNMLTGSFEKVPADVLGKVMDTLIDTTGKQAISNTVE